MPASYAGYDRTVERIAHGRYMSLTTFRRDGRPVATPVGCLVSGGTLYVLTPPDTGKVKRIRNNSRVTIAPCTMHGTVPPHAPVAQARARLLDEEQTRHVQDLMARRFAVFRLIRLADRLLRRRRPLLAIAVTA
ncbi:PPOX class F420-dependent oxidoreductase [Streptomyces sp. NPDC046984]|uniref:PPOX class F420-dependent oxidoreductase n=1 Tax=Streptomyces sp. NPDC046984 TaxID=3155138 RepID=UPI0033E698B6